MVKGSCLCGQLEYEVELMPKEIFNCYCSYCRKAHCAAFATVTLAKSDTLKINKGQNLLKEHHNKIGGVRSFCSNCAIRLMNHAPDKPLYLNVSLATVDTPVDFCPVAHVNVESKAA